MSAAIVHFDAFEFESTAARNGTLTWREDQLMEILGYESKSSFRKVVTKAMKICLSLDIIPHYDFIPTDDKYKFTRVACYLIAMSADSRKPGVARAQAYLAGIDNVLDGRNEHINRVLRVGTREEIKDGVKTLNSTAARHGVVDFARFTDAGYRGMYNKSLIQIGELKGLRTNEHLLDRMGLEELAANLFRVTQTDTKIKNEDVRGQAACEDTAKKVGKAVRRFMIRMSNTKPEELPLAEHISETKKKIKKTRGRMQTLSTPKEHYELRFIAVSEDKHTETEDPHDPGYTQDPEEDPLSGD